MSNPSGSENESDAKKPEKPEEKRENAGWIDNLARRSTGLPGDETKDDSGKRANDSKLWKMAGLGLQFAATIAIFAFMGNAVDKRMGWSPWGLVGFCFIAIIGNMYLLIKETLKDDGPAKPGRGK